MNDTPNINLSIKDKQALYAVYMPFIRNGGLFIPTDRSYTLGDAISLNITLLEANEKLAINTKIVWITPKGAQGKRASGVGVQFDTKDSGHAQKKIETYLAGAITDTKPTHTL